MYYHIKLMKRIDEGESKINISEEELLDRYVNPYLTGEKIVINGTTLDPNYIWRIKITCSTEKLDNAIEQLIRQENLRGNPFANSQSKATWKAIDKATDVTDKFINKPPGSLNIGHTEISNTSAPNSKHSNRVFVVHGHDTELKTDVELFLKNINLEPVVLHRQLDEGLTIIEKFEKHSDVNYAIILLTPDDIGFPFSEYSKKEEEREIEFRARQNVIFEFGYFVGKLSRKNVCCIFKENVTIPSDLSGLIYKQVTKTVEEIAMFLMKELKNAGLPVKFE